MKDVYYVGSKLIVNKPFKQIWIKAQMKVVYYVGSKTIVNNITKFFL
jgi:cell division ATPase FtsA